MRIKVFLIPIIVIFVLLLSSIGITHDSVSLSLRQGSKFYGINNTSISKNVTEQRRVNEKQKNSIFYSSLTSQWKQYENPINCSMLTSSFHSKNRYSLCKNKMIQQIAKHFSISNNNAKLIVSTTYDLSKNNGLDPLLILSMIATESSFNKQANNNYGALGLMQTVPRWHKDRMYSLGITKNDLLKVKPNIKLGIHIYKLYLDKSHGNIRIALQRYNGSSTDKTYRYSNKVFYYYKLLSQMG